ncbi:MAG: cytidylate kinase-like family protein [Intrasporangium sp.]|uniref:cytidylate kinase-like family protein n=1 Tax=Intrasporangium sp. TaxID=1925024 RepID=UPI0026485DEF|nr:cytidylate kinase-like family protein [Intrasporangium sp.]MDN5795861.1 cytidylate kinase-like family protein [Intrasporangium sp.]
MSEQGTVGGPGGTDESVKPVVTLWEQYGAGAEEIGQEVAKSLGLPFHAQAFSSDDLEHPEASLENRAVLTTVLGTMGGAYGGFEGRDIVTTQQERRDLITTNNVTVRQSAQEGGVIIGRNATVILADRPRTLHVLLTGEVKDRVERAAAAAGISVAQATKRQAREDDVRAEMSKVLYGWNPHEPDHYDLVLNTSRIPAAAAVSAIVNAIRATIS